MRGMGSACNALAADAAKGHLPPVETIDQVEWRVSDGLVPYEETHAFMEQRAAAIRAGEAAVCVWLLVHPPLFTAGTSADPAAKS